MEPWRLAVKRHYKQAETVPCLTSPFMKTYAAPAAAGGLPFPVELSSPDDWEDEPFLDDLYNAEDFQIQETILLSLDSSRAPSATRFFHSSSSPAGPSSRHAGASALPEPAEETPPDLMAKRKLPSEDGANDPKKRRMQPKRGRFTCNICMEKVYVSDRFQVNQCAHAFCNGCICRYVAAKVGENVTAIKCPDPECEGGVIEIDLCRDIVPSELIDRWSVALYEQALGDDKYYCPFKDCSALLINDSDGKAIRETECPHCHRLFCAQCRVPWHDGMKCNEFIQLADEEKEPDALRLKKLANKNNWQRCPKCKAYVSRIEGCLLMKCRCGQYFCYYCAAPMEKDIHYCNNCKH